MRLRMAGVSDCEELLAIYAEYIDTTVTFEYVLPTREEFCARIAEISREYPYIVCEDEGRIVGYAYAHRAGERAAYQWDAELAVYLAPDFRGRGLGGKLYGALESMLVCMGVYNAYACVTGGNAASCSFHAKRGYELMAVHDNAGYKNGRWLDVMWYKKRLVPDYDEPYPLMSVRELPPYIIESILKLYS